MLNPQETKMKVVLNEKDIRDAMVQYVHNVVLHCPGTQDYSVTIYWDSHRVEVEIDPK